MFKESFESPQPEEMLEDVLKMVEDLDKRRINPEEFRHTKFADEVQINEDAIIVGRLEEKFDKDPQRMSPEKLREFERGNAAEYTFMHALEETNWLAPSVTSIVPSKYDDYVRGIDTIAQIELGDGRFDHLGFAIDFGTSKKDIGPKVMKTLDSIDMGFSPSVRYFDSPKTGKLKELKMPRVVVGAGPESLDRLVNYSREILGGSQISEKTKAELENDPFRYVMLGEILVQLDFCINRIQKVIDDAKSTNNTRTLERAQSTLALHEKAMNTLMTLIEKSGISITDIQKHVKGDGYAIELAKTLSALSPLPIGFGFNK